MTKKFFTILFAITLLLTICLSAGIAQNKLTDSLKRVWTNTKDDTTRVLVIADLGLQFRNTNPDSSIYYGQKALTLAKQINFLRGEALALNTICLAMREKGELPKALELAIEAYKIALPNNYIFETSLSLRRIGLVYMDLKDYSTSLKYLKRALHISESIQHKRGMAIEYMNIGMTYEYMSMIDSALYFIQKAEIGKEYIEDLYPEVNRVFGNIYAKKGNQKLALFYYHRGIDAGSALNDFRTISFIHADAARMFKQLNQTDSSILYAKNGLKYGQMASYKKGILFSSNILAEIHDSINPAEALRYYKIAAEAKEGLFGAGNLQAIQALVAKEESRQKEIELARAAYQAQLKQYALLGSLGVFLVIALLLYRNNLNRKKANELLQQQKSEIEIQKKNVEHALADLKSTQSQLIQSEKMASLGELTAGIAHEIQNPLNFVNNFSEVNTELIKEIQDERRKTQDQRDEKLEDELLQDIVQNQEKINHHGKRASDIVKGMLQHSRSSSGVKEPTDINKLADEYLRLAYHGLRAKDKSFNATMKTDFDETIGKINVVPQDIGRVILNLITNAFYAVNEKRTTKNEAYDPTVSVSTKKEGNKVLVSVKDNGNGIPQKILDKIFQPFFTTKPTGQGTGLGLSLSYDIITKVHQGEIKVTTKEGEGTEFIVVLPT